MSELDCVLCDDSRVVRDSGLLAVRALCKLVNRDLGACWNDAMTRGPDTWPAPDWCPKRKEAERES